MRRVVWGIVLAACSTSNGDAVTQSMDIISSDSTHIRLARSGDGYGNRYRRLREFVPAVDELTSRGRGAAGRLVDEFEKEPDASRDTALVVYAYALGALGEKGALAPLGDFLTRTRSGDLWLAPQAATHTVLLLAGDPRLDTRTYAYSLADIDHAASVAGSGASSTLRAASTAPPSCRRRYLLVDTAGKTLLAVEGTEFADVTRVSAKSDWQYEVTSGGGVYVPEFDGGVPNRRYNCAGYAFRELNRGSGWNVDAQTLFRNLVDAGLLRKKPGAPAPGDKVFYSAQGSIAHVAEVERIDTHGNAIVRNADNQSGVFDAAMDAPYYATRGYEATVYEWVSRPTVVEDPSVRNDSGYCNGQRPPDAGAPDACAPPSGNVVGFCAGENDCPPGGAACACRSGSEYCCPKGFCWTRDIVGCQQETCPPGVGRRYNDTCKCDPPNRAVFDPCTPGLLLDCIQGP